MRRLKNLGFAFSLDDFAGADVEELLAIDAIWKEYENNAGAPATSGKRKARR